MTESTFSPTAGKIGLTIFLFFALLGVLVVIIGLGFADASAVIILPAMLLLGFNGILMITGFGHDYPSDNFVMAIILHVVWSYILACLIIKFKNRKKIMMS